MKKWIGGLAALTLVTSSVVLLDADAKSVPKKPKVELGVDRLMDSPENCSGRHDDGPDVIHDERDSLVKNPMGHGLRVRPSHICQAIDSRSRVHEDDVRRPIERLLKVASAHDLIERRVLAPRDEARDDLVSLHRHDALV